jgi:hypothetical protein
MAAEATIETPSAPVAASPEPRAPAKEPAAADAKARKGEKPKKDEKAKKPKKGAKGAEDGGASASGAPNVAAHPRAARGVARAKSWGGLVGFVLGGYLSLPTNTLAAAGLRALLAGIACYVAVWAGAVFLWRRLVMLEIKSREQQLLAAAQAPVSRREPAAARGDRSAGRPAS